MMQRTGLVVALGLLIVAVGCQTQPSISGVVTGPEANAPEYAPEVTFKNLKTGDDWKLSQLYGDVTVVAFSTLEGEACARVSADILSAVQEMEGEGIPVIEVAYPTGACEVPACSVAFHERSYLLTCLVDPEGTARKGFGVGSEDLVFLLSGRDGKIEKVAPPEKIDEILEAAKEIEHDKNFKYTDFVY